MHASYRKWLRREIELRREDLAVLVRIQDMEGSLVLSAGNPAVTVSIQILKVRIQILKVHQVQIMATFCTWCELSHTTARGVQCVGFSSVRMSNP